ncbi:uncharacterized protein VTP21DRAFT_2627 [Calcarisporiella thermophila]|uniref:uncharacterized protein n=1 Tax=Calcarisporiella thermophila TaxID=911321 RepID=UPI00374435D6
MPPKKQSKSAPKRKRPNPEDGQKNSGKQKNGSEKNISLRKQPVTMTKDELSDYDSEENGESDFEMPLPSDTAENDFPEEEFEEEEEMNGTESEEKEGDSKGEGEDESRPNKKQKTETSRESHQKQKQLKNERKAARPNYKEIVYPAKKLWEELRQKRLEPKKRQQLMEQMMELMKGKVREFIFKHDASRIVQTCVKYANASQRAVIAEELLGTYTDLAKAKYGRFLVVKIMNYCPKIRENVIKEFYGKVSKLIRHREASWVIEEAYSSYASAEQRTSLLQEFYGPEFALFKSSNKKTKSLGELLRDQPAKKPAILKHLKETLSGVLDKGTIGHSIVHRGLLDYMSHADEKAIADMVEVVREQCVEILHTREGSQVTMLCLLHGTPKDRKFIVRSMKPFVVKICKEEYGHITLLRMFDVVDDTVLVGKNILSEITKNIEEIANDKYGKRVLLYLLAGRHRKYFTPSVIDSLASGDDIRQKTSKKDPQVRQKELLAYVSQSLLDYVRDNTAELIKDSTGGCFLVKEALLHAEGEKAEAINSLVDLCAKDPTETDEGDEHVFEVTCAGRVIKELVQSSGRSEKNSDEQDVREKKITIPSTPLDFAPALLESIRPYLLHHALHGGSFIIVALAENPATSRQALKELQGQKSQLEKALRDADDKKKERQEGQKALNPGVKVLVKLL